MTSNSEVVGGVDTYSLFKAETTYGTAVTPDSVFGGLIQNMNFEVIRNNTEHAGFVGTVTGDGRVTKKFTPGIVEVKASAEFRVQSFDFLEYLMLGTKTGSGTSGSPYVYSIGTSTKSITLSEEIDNVGTDSHRVYAGIVIDSGSIRCSVGEPVMVSLDMKGGKAAATTTVLSKVANLTSDLYNFSGGTIEMPDGTSIGNVIESIEISIGNNYEIKYGFNQEAVSARPRKLTLGVRFTLNYLDDDQLARLFGSATAITTQTPVTLALKFTRATAGAQYVDFVFSNVVINRISDSHQLNEYMIEDIENLASNLVVTEVQS